MTMNHVYAEVEPPREDIDALRGTTVVEFGAPWCPHCQNAQAPIAAAFSSHANVRHIKIEDGPRRRLGRSFRIKLWPTLIFMKDGVELARLVRPTDPHAIMQTMDAIDAT
jgi:thioredoxin 1